MVEENDYVLQLPESTIDNLTEEQIKSIRFQKFNHLGDTVREVQSLLKIDQLKKIDFAEQASIAENLLHTEDMSDHARHMLTRFNLACIRFQYGLPAYVEGNNYVSQELLASTTAPPITFTAGGFVPTLG